MVRRREAPSRTMRANNHGAPSPVRGPHSGTDIMINIVSVRSSVEVPLIRPDGRVLPSRFISFHGLYSRREHFAVRLGEIAPDAPPLVRLHSECATGDLFGSARCDCGPQLSEAIDLIAARGGYILYLRQEGRNIGLFAKLDAYKLQDQGMDTFAANNHLGFPDDLRDFTEAAMMLKALDVHRIELLSNNSAKIRQMTENGIEVARQVPTGVHLSGHNGGYMRAKAASGNHDIRLPEDPADAADTTGGAEKTPNASGNPGRL